MIKVDNAIIMAAGTSSRFAPLSYEKPKALIEVKGEILIERQIEQLKEVGINKIIVVTGYKAEEFEYLKGKYGVELIHNSQFLNRNNNESIYVAKNYIRNSYICSSDNYFIDNPFSLYEDEAYYSALYSDGETSEWCMEEDEDGYVSKVTIGGKKSWYMLGHVFWDETFSKKFLSILNRVYDEPETANKLWEQIYIENIDSLKMKIKKYDTDYIFEFDTLDELRTFDKTYTNNTRSKILKQLAFQLDCLEGDIVDIKSYKDSDNSAAGFTFRYRTDRYRYHYETKELEVLSNEKK